MWQRRWLSYALNVLCTQMDFFSGFHTSSTNQSSLTRPLTPLLTARRALRSASTRSASRFVLHILDGRSRLPSGLRPTSTCTW